MAKVNKSFCVVKISNLAGLSEEESQALLDRVRAIYDSKAARLRTAEAREQTLRAAMEQGLEMERQSLLRHRNNLLSMQKYHSLDVRLGQALAGGAKNVADALFIDMLGTAKRISGGHMSTAATQTGLKLKYLGEITYQLKQHPELHAALKDPGLFASAERRAMYIKNNEELTRELQAPGSGQASPMLKEFAQVLRNVYQRLHQEMLDAGANVGRITNYTPHKYNVGRIASARSEAVVNDLKQDLDLLATFPWLEMVEPGRYDDALRAAIDAAYQHILKGSPLEGMALDPRAYLPQSMQRFARRLEQSRQLVFTNDGWIDFNRKYGEISALATMFDYIESSTMLIGIMQRYGPNPMGTIQAAAAARGNQLRALSGGAGKDVQKQIAALRSADITNQAGKVGRAYRTISGADRIPESISAAKIASTTRNLASMAKLGGAVISAIPDMANMVLRLKTAFGVPWHKAWGQALAGVMERIPRASRAQQMKLLDTFSDGLIGAVASRFDPENTALGGMVKVNNVFYKVSGLTGWTDNARIAQARMISNHAGMLAGNDFNELGREFQLTLRKYGLEHQWDFIRLHMVRELDDNGTKRFYLLPEMAHSAPDDAIKSLVDGRHFYANNSLHQIREAMETRLSAFIASETNHGVLVPDAMNRNTLLRGSAPGTMVGEGLRFIGQFKSFPIGFWQKIMMPIIYGSPYQGAEAMGVLAFHIAQVTALGWVAMELKRMLKGEKPIFMGQPTPGNLTKAFVAAFIQGGGAGLYGDFLLAERSRFGGGMLESLAGPVIGGALNDLDRIRGAVIAGEFRGADLLRFTVSNTPYANLWYTKAALDYAIVFNLQEMLNPGYLKRMEARKLKESGREYMVPPSEVIRSGGGFR